MQALLENRTRLKTLSRQGVSLVNIRGNRPDNRKAMQRPWGRSTSAASAVQQEC